MRGSLFSPGMYMRALDENPEQLERAKTFSCRATQETQGILGHLLICWRTDDNNSTKSDKNWYTDSHDRYIHN